MSRISKRTRKPDTNFWTREHPNYFDREEYMCQASDNAKGDGSSPEGALQLSGSAEAVQCHFCGRPGLASVLKICGDCYDEKIVKAAVEHAEPSE